MSRRSARANVGARLFEDHTGIVELLAAILRGHGTHISGRCTVRVLPLLYMLLMRGRERKGKVMERGEPTIWENTTR